MSYGLWLVGVDGGLDLVSLFIWEVIDVVSWGD